MTLRIGGFRWRLLILFALGTGLAACGQPKKPPEPLDARQRADFVLELVEKRIDCDAFRLQLQAPDRSIDDVEAIYREALRARCINKDA